MGREGDTSKAFERRESVGELLVFPELLCSYSKPSLCGDIHVLHVRILTLQLTYRGALAVDFMSYAGKWSKQVFNTQCVCYSTRSVCLSVCLSTSY